MEGVYKYQSGDKCKKLKYNRENKAKSWLFKKIKKIDKPLTRLTKKKKNQNLKLLKLETERNITTEFTIIKRII